MYQIMLAYIIQILHEPHDTFPNRLSVHKNLVKDAILDGSYHEVLTLVEFILRNKNCPQPLQIELENVFKVTPVAYMVQTMDEIPTIVARSNEESGAATKEAIEVVEGQGPEGAKTHLRKATEAINQKQYADSVGESIHAVESVARTIDPASATTLRPRFEILGKGRSTKSHSTTKSL